MLVVYHVLGSGMQKRRTIDELTIQVGKTEADLIHIVLGFSVPTNHDQTLTFVDTQCLTSRLADGWTWRVCDAP